ncbi:MAG: DUF4864 domain-containing protein [Alphaproteobacteria bacterium]
MRLSRRVFLVLAVVAVGYLGHQDIKQSAAADTPVDRAAIVTVIRSQLDAFKRDDARDAFSYASPFIQQKFQSAAMFMDMVKRGYMPLYRPNGTEFLELTIENGIPVQRVRVYAPDGTPISAYYFMQRQEDGSWRINGVELRLDADPAV